jgi:membrane protein YqaA with SNARE-associated domain
MDAASLNLAGLFASAFLSATLLPGNSEIALAALLAHDPSQHWAAIGVATAGNTLGGLSSYALGRFLPRPKTQPRALGLAQRFGAPALLLSWVPFIGDALCVASGWLRQNAFVAAACIAAGKFARYLALAEGVRAFAA